MHLDSNAEPIAHRSRSARARPVARAALPVLILVWGLALPVTRGEGQEGPLPPPAPSAHGPRVGRGWSLETDELLKRMTERLDLTADQQDRLKGLVERFRASHGDALARARELREGTRAAHGSGTRPSREDLTALAGQYGNPGRELAPALKQLRDEALSILGPEQRRKLDDLRARWHDRCRGGHGPGRGLDGFGPDPTRTVPPT